MARRALALAPVLTALALSVGACDLGDAGGTADDPPPLVTHPSSGSTVPDAPGGLDGEGPGSACGGADDVTAALVAGDAVTDRVVQIVPDCSELEVPVPFTVPTDGERPRSV